MRLSRKHLRYSCSLTAMAAAIGLAVAVPDSAAAGNETAVNPFNPGTVINSQLAASQPVAPPARSLPAAPAAEKPAPAVFTPEPAAERIVLEINLDIDRRGQPSPPPTAQPPSPPKMPASANNPFDFTKDGVMPVALSVPPEGTPVAPYVIPEPQPEPRKVEAERPEPLPFTTENAAIHVSEPEGIQLQSEAPIHLGASTFIGDDVPDSAPCFTPAGSTKRICVLSVDWPAATGHLFEVSSILYRGQKAIARVDEEGRTNAVYSLFPTEHFTRIAGHFTLAFGTAEDSSPPMPLIGNPNARNTVLHWKREDFGGRTLVLELRANDDLRDILPDERHGVVRLGYEDGTPLFDDLQTSDFLLRTMRADAS